MKKCKRGHVLTAENTVINKAGKRQGKYKGCRTCINDLQRVAGKRHRKKHAKKRKEYGKTYNKQYSDEHKERRKHRSLLLKYGITLEEHTNLRLEQDNLCANKNCGVKLEGKHCHTDHCHTTNKVRGLLCNNCNLALGQLRDDVNVILGLAEYLQNHK